MLVTVESFEPFKASVEALNNLEWKPMKDKIFIKPNIGATSKFVNTDPEIVRGIIHYLKNLGYNDIVVGDGSVETEYEHTSYNFHHQGWDKLAKEENISLIDLNRSERMTISWHYGSLKVPKVLDGRSYINVAKMKTHIQAKFSLCMKNQKGILDSSERKHFHRLGLIEPIRHLAKAVKPELCVVDGIVGIEGNGPGDLGKPKKVGIVVAGDNIFEVDAKCMKIMEERNFLMPSGEFKMFNVHMRPENACSACLSSVGKTNKLARRSWIGRWYFLKHGFFRRMDIIVGSPKELPKNHGQCVFYGNCAKAIAERYPQYPWFKGCPPVSKKVLEGLING